jgi:hypothetical protein
MLIRRAPPEASIFTSSDGPAASRKYVTTSVVRMASNHSCVLAIVDFLVFVAVAGAAAAFLAAPGSVTRSACSDTDSTLAAVRMPISRNAGSRSRARRQ